jgi:putative flippase GtrA
VSLPGKSAVLAAAAWIRSPELGLVGQGMRFAIAGATAALVSLGATITLSQGCTLPLEAAFAIGYATGLTAHFTLQRVFVWRHHAEFALSGQHQLARYLPIALTNYGVIALAIALLPRLLGVAPVAVYLVATGVVTTISFLLFRTRVFHAGDLGKEHR